MINVNLNAMCSAALTEHGAKLWNAQYENTPPEYKPAQVETGEILNAELWKLMQVYGAGFYNGMPASQLPFFGNVIGLSETL